MTDTSTHFNNFVTLTNEGKYRDALLALEEVWKVDRNEFYAGILQLLVSLNQLHAGMKPRRTLQRAHERITPFASTYKGLDVIHLLTVTDACIAILPADETAPLTGEIPRLLILVEQ